MRSAPALLALALFPLEREVSNRAGSGIALRLHLPPLFPLLSGCFLLFLVFLGLLLVQSIARVSVPLHQVLGLPRRSSARREWALGAVLGWIVPLLCTGLLVLVHGVQFSFWTGAQAWLFTLTTLAGLAFSVLAVELTFRGLPFRWLSSSIGPAWSSLLLSILFALTISPAARHSFLGLLVWTLLGEALAVAWLRTHALWLSWALHFAWMAVFGVLFGLPVAGSTSLSTVIGADLSSAPRILGGFAGPEVSVVALLGLGFVLAVLVRSTRDLAWQYTQPTLVPGGYPVDVPPPAAHAAVFPGTGAPPPPPPLVQILPQSPQERSQLKPDR